jgi:ATP-dependent protease ClpP protease subunit
MIKTMLALACAVSANLCEAAPSEVQLTTTNTVTFRGEVSPGSVTEVMVKLSKLALLRGSSNYPIYLVLDSPGGSIMAGDMLVQYLRTLSNVHTITIFSASMAAGIVEANKGIRYITPSGILMFHRASGSFEGQFNSGELESQLRLWTSIVNIMEQANADRLGITLQDYKARIVNEWWMLGQEAVQNKAMDFVVSVRCSQNLINQTQKVTESSLFFQVELEYSDCPLFRAPLSINNKE